MLYKVLEKKSILFILMLVGLTLIHFNTFWEAAHNNYYPFEHDAYLHMVFALDVMQHPHWYAGIYPLVNAPYGADTHAWTQMTMMVLLFGTFFFKFFLPLKSALFWWCFIVPLLFKLISIFALIWAAKPLKRQVGQDFFIGLAFLCNPFLYHVYMPLRVDYDFILVTISIFYWGCLLRFIDRNTNYWAFFCALTAVLGLWTSISFAIPLFIGMAIIFWFSLIQDKCSPKKVYFFLAMLCLFCLLILPLEHQPAWEISYDVISIVYLVFYSLTLISVVFFVRLKKNNHLWNAISALVLISLIYLIMNYFFPGFYHGPYKAANSFLLTHFFPTIYELHSPFLDSNLLLAISCYVIIGSGYFYYLYLNHELTTLQIIFLGIALVLSTFALYMYRWERLAAPLSLVLIAVFLIDFSIIKRINPIIKAVVTIVVLILPATLYTIGRDPLNKSERECQQQMVSMLHDKFLDLPQFNKDRSVLITANYGPLILFFTHLGIIATNDHHNPMGFEDQFNFFHQDELSAKKIVMSRSTDLILLCKKTHILTFDVEKSNWLSPVLLPNAYSKWVLYRRVN
jgi:hypothetical protein